MIGHQPAQPGSGTNQPDNWQSARAGVSKGERGTKFQGHPLTRSKRSGRRRPISPSGSLMAGRRCAHHRPCKRYQPAAGAVGETSQRGRNQGCARAHRALIRQLMTESLPCPGQRGRTAIRGLTKEIIGLCRGWGRREHSGPDPRLASAAFTWAVSVLSDRCSNLNSACRHPGRPGWSAQE
jgi:hypothetical protein